MLSQAKKYSNLKYTCVILDILLLVSFLFVFLKAGFSMSIAQTIEGLLANKALDVALYLLFSSFIYYCISFGLNFYRSFILEHKFLLSSQKINDWLLDQLKSGVISYLIALILVGAFYLILWLSPQAWWFWVSLFWICFNFIFAKLLPVVVIPLFFKYKPLTDESLRARIMLLAKKMKINILDCFEIDFSKKTLKANAAFVGWGATRRVILADTLKDKYTYDEIEAILVHEFAHYKMRHLLKLILTNSLVTLVCFYIIFRTSNFVLGFFGFSDLSQLGALPLVFLYFVIFGFLMEPFGNFLSRYMERNADKMAIEVTGNKEAFILMMEKLSSQNLADRKPNPIIKFFFFDHPSIEERIEMARRVK
ncbi:MAG: M48 family metallopeptidase [Candidatus Omnitrophica bacterium]|nr:M48 family metallopeptidase [Candidatus Omnitrophota bacterium]